MTYDPNAGRITAGGLGDFLNPPTHPEHDFHVETELRRLRDNRVALSLSYAATCAWLSPATRAAAKRKLDAWQAPPIDSPEVQDWILQVLGYFNSCYKGDGPEPDCWHAAKLRMSRDTDPVLSADLHAGVHLIRQYYPDFVPTAEHFAAQYWGSKPTTKEK